MAKRVFHLFHPSTPHQAWVHSLVQTQPPPAPCAWVARDHPRHTDTVLDWCLLEGIERLVVWGGDGTLHRVVQRLWRLGALGRMELALVPTGTCNDLARFYGLTQDQWHLWEAPEPEGRLVSLPLGRVSWGEAPDQQDIFFNNAGFGRTRKTYEKKLSPWQLLQSFQTLPLVVEWEEGRLDGRYYMGLVCRHPYFSGGLHFETVGNAEENLRLYLVPATSKMRLGWRLARGRCGLSLADDKITRLCSRRVVIESAQPLWPQADGESPPHEGVHKVKFDMLSARMRLWVPAQP